MFTNIQKQQNRYTQLRRHKTYVNWTYVRRSEHVQDVLYTFNLRPVSAGKPLHLNCNRQNFIMACDANLNQWNANWKNPFSTSSRSLVFLKICSQKFIEGNVHLWVGCIFWKVRSAIFQTSNRSYFQQIPRMAAIVMPENLCETFLTL